MLLERFDDKKYERSLREEGREEGRAEGKAEGSASERVRMNKLISSLLAQSRIDDLRRAAEEPAYQEQLFGEFGL